MTLLRTLGPVSFSISVLLAGCGGSSARAAWPDVAATDRTADELGLASEDSSDAEMAPAGSESSEPRFGDGASDFDGD